MIYFLIILFSPFALRKSSAKSLPCRNLSSGPLSGTTTLAIPYYGRAQQTLFPAAIPLAVRSPYLSCWDQTTVGTNLGTLWPTTSNPKQVCCLPFPRRGNQNQCLSDTWLGRPRAHRRINVFFLGGRSRGKY